MTKTRFTFGSIRKTTEIDAATANPKTSKDSIQWPTIPTWPDCCGVRRRNGSGDSAESHLTANRKCREDLA